MIVNAYLSAPQAREKRLRQWSTCRSGWSEAQSGGAHLASIWMPPGLRFAPSGLRSCSHPGAGGSRLCEAVLRTASRPGHEIACRAG